MPSIEIHVNQTYISNRGQRSMLAFSVQPYQTTFEAETTFSERK